MNQRFSFFALLFLLFAAQTNAQSWSKAKSVAPNYYAIRQQFLDHWEGKPIEKGTGYSVFRRWEWRMKSRILDDGSFPPANMHQLEWEKYLASHPGANLQLGANWTSLGPNSSNSGYNGIGRINCITLDPNNSNTIWIGTPAGGLWKTTNGGGSWTTNTDNLTVLGVTAVVIDPLNPSTMYIGTGDGFSSDTRSIGVLKSTDGGNSWNPTGLVFAQNSYDYIRAMAINPNDPNILFVASSNGLYRTINAGESWVRINPADFFDVKFKPGDPSIVFAASSNRVYKSTNSGANFASVQTISKSDRIAIAVTPANPDMIAAVSSSNEGDTFGALNGIYVSTDGGTSFALKATTPNLLGSAADGSSVKGQGWYDLCIAISPTNANTIFVGGVNLWKSTNMGANWSLATFWYNGGGGGNVPTVHADKHALTWNGNTLFVGCDGGIYKTSNSGGTFTSLSSNLVISQMYRLGVSQSDNQVITGLQDNGTKLRNNSGFWTDNIGGDGMECFIHPTEPFIMFGEYQGGRIHRSLNGGDDWDDIHKNVPGEPEGAWETPFVIDPSESFTIYAGYRELYKSEDLGDSWYSISPTLSLINNLVHVAVSPVSSSTIYMSDGYDVYKTNNGGDTWSTATGNLPNNYITYLTADPENINTLYVTNGGYDNTEKVYKSTDGGATWVNISGTLPNLPANCVIVEPNSGGILYLAMDVGVYRRDAFGSDWELFATGLPNAPVEELEIKTDARKICAATYGRGAWISDLAANLPPALSVAPGALVFPGIGGVQTVTLTSTCSWSVENVPAWLQVSPASGSAGNYTITATTLANLTPDTLSATINFTGCGNAVSQQFGVAQFTTDPFLNLSPATLHFGPLGGTQNITLTTNCHWEITNPSPLLTIDPPSGAAGTITVAITLAPNTTPVPLFGLFDVVGCNGSATSQLEITQDQATLNAPDLIQVPANEGIVQIPVESNTQWLTTEDSPWLDMLDPTTAFGDTLVQVKYLANPDPGTRDALVMFTFNGFQRAVTIQQSGTVGVADLDAPKEWVTCMPNPMRTATSFLIRSANSQEISLEIYAEDGRRVDLMPSVPVKAGENTVVWQRGKLAAGTYLYRCVLGSGVISGKVVLLD